MGVRDHPAAARGSKPSCLLTEDHRMSDSTPTVYLIDDDEEVLTALSHALRANGFVTACFTSAVEFRNQFDPALTGCIVLDYVMPDMDGLELQERLAAAGSNLPVIFLTHVR